MRQPSFSELLQHIMAVIRQPELHMREVPILVGLGILLVFIILVLIAIIFVRPVKQDPKPVEAKELRLQIRRRSITVLALGIAVIALLGVFSAYTAKPDFCVSCHEMKTAYKKASSTVHERVKCVSCHQQPGIIAAFTGRLELVDMLAAKAGLWGDVISAQVSNEACLTCHSDILKSVVVSRTIRMKHKEPLDAGYRCIDCHFSKGLFHVEKRQLDDFGMSRCVDCHEQKKASADCNTCHTDRGGAKLSLNRDDYPMVNLPDKISCKSCHLASSCLECHTLQLPHSEDWTKKSHALEAFTEKKLCFECHDEATCGKCHQESPHGDDWVKGHKEAVKASPAWCSSCHKTEFCLICHKDTAGYELQRELPAPKTSPRENAAVP